MEAGGAKIEETLQRLNCTQQNLSFITGWVVILTSICLFFSSLTRFAPLGLAGSIFLLVFGFLLMVIDVPGNPRWASRYRQMISHQAKFLTRITGKAVFTFYLGSMILYFAWPNGKTRAGVSSAIGIMIGFSVMAVGVLGFVIVSIATQTNTAACCSFAGYDQELTVGKGSQTSYTFIQKQHPGLFQAIRCHRSHSRFAV